ncbi:MAG: hypothetical protein MI919_00200, partial [Holophagales bacterium]|nr:hypothetical protein [Holophagales bacterium]
DLKVEVYGDDGEVLATLPGGKRRGLNRVDWPMRYKAPKLPAATNLVPAFIGPWVPEGTYRVKLIKGKTVLEGSVSLVPDQREPFSTEERELQQSTSLELYHALEELTFLIENLVHVRDEARERAEGLGRRDAEKLRALAEEAETMRTSLVSTNKAGWLSGEMKLREELGELFGNITSWDGRPTTSQMEEKARLMSRLETAGTDLQGFLDNSLAEAERILARRGAEAIGALDREAWMAENSGTGASASVLLSSKPGRRYLASRLGLLVGAL